MPCGVTVDVSLSMIARAAATTSTPRSRARIASSCSSSSTNSVSIAGGSAASASRTPWAPSTRKRRFSSRNARLRSRAAAATFGFLVLEITRPPNGRAGAPVVRSLAPRDRRNAMRSGGGRFGQRVLRLLHERGERAGVVDREIGEHLAVELDPGGLQAVHEPRVGDPVGSDARVDARDPEPAELCLAVAPVAVGVHAGVVHLLLREAIAHATAAGIALGGRKRLAALLLRVDGSFHSCHRVTFPAGASASSARRWTRPRPCPPRGVGGCRSSS